MNALFEEQDDFVIEESAENIMPVSVYEDLKIHHEKIILENLIEAIESVGGIVHNE